MKIPLAYSYLRWSTPEQMIGSMDRQTKAARVYADTHGLELSEESFTDAGLSAYKGRNLLGGKLGLFKRAVEDGIVESGSYLLIENLDRLSRQHPMESTDLLRDLCNLGINVVTLSDGQIYSKQTLTDNPMQFLMAYVVASRSYDESRIKRERTLASRRKRLEGLRDGSEAVWTAQCPRWLQVVDGQYEAIPVRVKIVKRIYKEFLAGGSCQGIAKGLNADGCEMFRGGAHWRGPAVKKILKAVAVTGTLVANYDGDAQPIIKKIFPRVITVADYYRVQRRWEVPQSRGKRKVINPIGGIAKCGECGSGLTRDPKGNGYTYLRCTGKKNGNGCQFGLIDYDRFLDQLTKELPRIINQLPSGHSHIDDAIGEAEDREHDLYPELDDIVLLLTQGDSPTLRKQLAALEAELQAVRDELLKLRAEYERISPKSVQRRLRLLVERADNPAFVDAIQSIVVGDVGSNTYELTISWHHLEEETIHPIHWFRVIPGAFKGS